MPYVPDEVRKRVDPKLSPLLEQSKQATPGEESSAIRMGPEAGLRIAIDAINKHRKEANE